MTTASEWRQLYADEHELELKRSAWVNAMRAALTERVNEFTEAAIDVFAGGLPRGVRDDVLFRSWRAHWPNAEHPAHCRIDGRPFPCPDRIALGKRLEEQ